MEKAVLITDRTHMEQADGYGRVYFGAEFCQHLIPRLKELKSVYAAVTSAGKKFTLLTPYVTNEGIARLRTLFDFLNDADVATEVVFNDWGVHALIGKEYKRLSPVVGRLLTKQRRDPLAYDIIYNRQKPLTMRSNGNTLVCYPKKCPPLVLEHYRASLVNMPVFQSYLIAHGVMRAELDNLLWDMKVSVNKKMRLSVYLPYGYVSTTRFCGMINLSRAGCRKECRKRYISLDDERSPVPLYIRGNSVFYKSSMPAEKYLSDRGIDRVVFQAE